MKKNFLKLTGIDFYYGKKRVLNNVSICIKEGSFFVLLGLNGAGKSTIFSLITRLQNLEIGEITINDYCIKNYSNALKDIGIVFQEATLDLDDEATVGLDLKSRFDILNYIRKLVITKNISVLWITHLFDEVNEDDNISIIKNGEIIESGVVQDIVKKYAQANLIDTFNILVREEK